MVYSIQITTLYFLFLVVFYVICRLEGIEIFELKKSRKNPSLSNIIILYPSLLLTVDGIDVGSLNKITNDICRFVVAPQNYYLNFQILSVFKVFLMPDFLVFIAGNL